MNTTNTLTGQDIETRMAEIAAKVREMVAGIAAGTHKPRSTKDYVSGMVQAYAILRGLSVQEAYEAIIAG
jgi:hypothetical protein